MSQNRYLAGDLLYRLPARVLSRCRQWSYARYWADSMADSWHKFYMEARTAPVCNQALIEYRKGMADAYADMARCMEICENGLSEES